MVVIKNMYVFIYYAHIKSPSVFTWHVSTDQLVLVTVATASKSTLLRTVEIFNSYIGLNPKKMTHNPASESSILFEKTNRKLGFFYVRHLKQTISSL